MLNRPRVLIANPDPGIRRLLRRHFGNAGYSVLTAELGRTVLDQLQRSAPDVIILSSEMDDLECVDLVGRLHAMTNTPLLVLNPVEGRMSLVKSLTPELTTAWTNRSCSMNWQPVPGACCIARAFGLARGCC